MPRMLLNAATCCVGFAFPLAMTVSHMAFSFVTLAPIMMLPSFRGLHKATLQKQWKGMLFIGAFLALNIALNNISLVEISLSLNQVIRCAAHSAPALVQPLCKCFGV